MDVDTRTRVWTHPWTATQDAELRWLAQANTPAVTIAARLRGPTDEVLERANELGVILATRN